MFNTNDDSNRPVKEKFGVEFLFIPIGSTHNYMHYVKSPAHLVLQKLRKSSLKLIQICNL